MKRSFFNLSFLAGWLMLLLAGCQSPMAGDRLPHSGGQKLTTALSVTPPVDPRQTKSSYAGADDAVRNWNLFVFENGVLQAKYYQNTGSDLSLNVMTDRPYHYFALANVGDLTGRFVVGTTTVDDMAALRIDADIENGLPMAWSSAGVIAFSRRQLAAGQKLPVALTRLVGRYDIVVDRSGLSDWSFTATRLSLCGVSDVTPFAGRSRASAASVVTDEASAADLAALNAGSATSYYPVENCLGTLLPEGGSPWNKIPANIPSDAFPSYIELGGILRMTDGSQLERQVIYRFCLGENASDNFDVVRNQTHTVTLQLSDASIASDGTHWKLEKGSFTDTRSLAFTHESIQLDAGATVEEPIVRIPAGLKYVVEADASLVQAGVSVQGHDWGDVCDSDGLVLTAPAEVSYQTGTIRLKTLDGSKTAAATLTVGRIPPVMTGLRIEPDEVYLPAFGDDYRVYGYHNPEYARATPYTFRVYAVYNDGTETDVSTEAGWEGNRFYSYWDGTYYHFINLLAYNGCDGLVTIYRMYYDLDYGVEACMGPSNDEEYNYYLWQATPLSVDSRASLLTATYSSNGTVWTADVYGTLVNPAKPQRLDITPGESEVFADGSQVSFSATCTLTDGSTEDVTDKASWQADSLVESLGNGQFTVGEVSGETLVRASYTAGGVTVEANARLTLLERTISRIELSLKDGNDWVGGRQEVSLGSQQQWRVRAVYEDGGSRYLYDGFSLTSSQPAVVAVTGSSSRAMALGTAEITASFNGWTSNSVTLDVMQHSYTYDFYVWPAPIELSWNETRRFTARVYRYDNDVLDPSFGTEGSIDVSSEAEWEISDELLAVASWNAGSRELTAANTTASAVTGKVWAHYDGMSNYSRVTIGVQGSVNPETPTLSVSPTALSWTAAQAGSSSAKSFTITSNTDWTIGGGGDHWSVNLDHGSGNATVTVYPTSANAAATDVVAGLSVSGTGVSARTVTLTHKGQNAPPPATLQYKVVTTLEDASIQVGGSTTVSAVLYASSDGGDSYPDVISTQASSFSNEASGSHVTLSGSTVTGASAGSARIRGHFVGYSVAEYVDASLTVVAAPVSKYLNVSPMNLSWAWDASGSSQSGLISVSSNTSWTVKQCSAGFGWSKSGASVSVWPLADNDSFSDDKTGVLVLGGDGVSDVTVNLKQGKRSKQLTGIRFDQTSYELVRIVSGSLCYWRPFSVTALYDDGSSTDVTRQAQYADQGNLSVNTSTGRLTATAASNGRTLTATWQGFSASASYSAEELECPESLTVGRLESQDEKSRMFVLGDVTITLSKAFVGTIEREESETVTCTCSPNIVFEQYQPDSGWQFHFTENGTGSVSFSYTLNGKTVSGTIELICEMHGKIRKK